MQGFRAIEYATMMPLPDLTPPAVRPCKICGQLSPVYGAIDFNRICSDHDPDRLPPANLLVAYNRCGNCGFVFTSCFDCWSHQDFQTFIYNDQYVEIDPDYVENRPAANLTWVRQEFGGMRRNCRFLDYGGGNGRLAELMRQDGFNSVEVYDPIEPRFSAVPDGKFEVITCFETLEHLPDPVGTARQLAELATPQSIIFFSTLLQPDNFNSSGLFWPYIAPRNGHISLYTAKALDLLFAPFRFTVSHLNEDKHVAMTQGIKRNAP